MNEKQREAMARLEFGDRFSCIQSDGGYKMMWLQNPIDTVPLPTYDSHDDVQRVRLKIMQEDDSTVWDKIIKELMRMQDCAMDEPIGESDVFLVSCMEPAEWGEAILRAKGLWEEE